MVLHKDLLYVSVSRILNFSEVGPTLYKCYANVLCLLGMHIVMFMLYQILYQILPATFSEKHVFVIFAVWYSRGM